MGISIKPVIRRPGDAVIGGVLVVNLVEAELKQEPEHVIILVHHAEELLVQVHQQKHNHVILNHAVLL
jgi:hypothetical protein